jgi:hypothetical protein
LIVQKNDQLVPRIDVPLYLDREVLEELPGLFPVPPDLFMAAVDACVGHLRWVVGFDVRMHQGKDGIEVSAGDRFIAFPSKLHVLLRHRLTQYSAESGVGVSVLL